ncbi:MAG: hypothetical protein DRP42_02275 [Tenericutes bacterium]|nr:MAG: hypothetical protein DRP42_02275 [Mycoplasmatota bacterium]
MLNNLAEIGTIVNTHGIKGELRFAPINDQYYGYIIVGQNILIGETSYEVEKVRNHKK